MAETTESKSTPKNSMSVIRNYFEVDASEFRKFWESLTSDEKDELRNSDLINIEK